MTTPIQQKRMITADELAAMLQVSKRHIYRLLDRGAIPQPVRLGNSVRWDDGKIQDWIAAGCPANGNY